MNPRRTTAFQSRSDAWKVAGHEAGLAARPIQHFRPEGTVEPALPRLRQDGIGTSLGLKATPMTAWVGAGRPAGEIAFFGLALKRGGGVVFRLAVVRIETRFCPRTV